MKIELWKVRKNFGRLAVLRGIDLTIASGERVGLVGPNGSGKSTLIRALMGMYVVEGQVRLDGKDPLKDRESLAPQIAYAPQEQPRTGYTVDEVVAAVRRLRGLDESKIEDVAERLNLSIAECGAKKFRELSGGTKQKLTLALAFASRPSLLILDEPSASLDTETRRRFYELFEQMAETATLLLSSHRIDEIRQLVDRVVVLEDGIVKSQGITADFLEENAGRVTGMVSLES